MYSSIFKSVAEWLFVLLKGASIVYLFLATLISFSAWSLGGFDIGEWWAIVRLFYFLFLFILGIFCVSEMKKDIRIILLRHGVISPKRYDQ